MTFRCLNLILPIISCRLQSTLAFIILIFGSVNQTFALQMKQSSLPVHTKKRVLVLSNSQGGGHKTAAEAICSYLDPEKYECSINSILDNRVKGDRLFDVLFSQERWKTLKVLTAPSTQKMVENHVSISFPRTIRKEIKSYNPDIVLSVNPLANFLYFHILKKMNIPFIIVPTDLTPSAFLHRIDKVYNKERLTLLLPILDSKVKRKLKKHRLLKVATVSGYPVRSEFIKMANDIENKNPKTLSELQELKTQYNMGAHDKLVLISMGAKGFGLKTLKQYVKIAIKNKFEILADKKAHLHLAIACGSNSICFEYFSKKQQGDQVTIHPLGFKNAWDFASLMVISDVLLIKPGGATIGESLTLSKRLLIKSDSTQSLYWEKFNMDYYLRNGWGLSLHNANKGQVHEQDFVKKLSTMLQESKQIKIPQNKFPTTLINTIEGLLN